MMTSCDDGVISTNDDASGCKRHAVRVGYWKDEYIGSFVSNTDRKAPEINRGYYARVKGIEVCIDKFLEVNAPQHLLLFGVYWFWSVAAMQPWTSTCALSVCLCLCVCLISDIFLDCSHFIR